MDQSSVLAHPDAARRQIEAESHKQPRIYAPGEGGGGEVEEGKDVETGVGGPNGERISVPPTQSWSSRGFHGVVEIDLMRLGGSAWAISQEGVQQLASIMGSNVRVTLEIGADVPDGIPEKVERDVSGNCNTLRFREYVCVSKLQRFPGVVNDTAGPNPSKTYMHIPPLLMCEISVVNCNLPSLAQVKRK